MYELLMDVCYAYLPAVKFCQKPKRHSYNIASGGELTTKVHIDIPKSVATQESPC